jgi:3-oxoacyl-[acyl-carrier protein] reductase
MDLGLSGKSALVTAASKGLGKAIATEFAREGCKVAICARNMTALKEASSEIEKKAGTTVLPIKADVTSRKQVDTMIESVNSEFGRIDILVSNAGGPPLGTFDRLEYRSESDCNDRPV